MTQIAKNITAYRTAAGETQGDLGALLGVTDKAISKWESGQTEPNLDAVVRIAGHYKTTVEDLLGVNEKQRGGIFRNLPDDTAEQIKKVGSWAWDAARDLHNSVLCTLDYEGVEKAVPRLRNSTTRVRVRLNSRPIYMFSVSEPDMNLTLAQFQNESNFA